MRVTEAVLFLFFVVVWMCTRVYEARAYYSCSVSFSFSSFFTSSFCIAPLFFLLHAHRNENNCRHTTTYVVNG